MTRALVTVVAAALVVLTVLLTGCTGTGSSSGSYTVDSSGAVSLTCPAYTANETIVSSNATYTLSRIVFSSADGDVVTYLGAPVHPKAVIVYAPGAGEKAAGHAARMERYSAAGYGFMFVDVRGNGGESAGIPFGSQMLQQDYAKFEKGGWPQYYITVCDMISAQKFISARYGVPVYAVGGSNGGRYAAVAAGVDPQFAGYIGISTSDWGILSAMQSQGATGDILRFATSLEPSTYIGKISPRPVLMFHNATDPVIAFSEGKALFAQAKEPKTFIEFQGDHGIDPDVDDRILQQWAQIYGTQG